MNNIPGVAVVILNWNGKAYLEKFLPFVLKSEYNNLKVIVADNNSDDGSVELISTRFPQVQLILNSRNYGYAGGYNEALKQVESDYFVLLNSDVQVQHNWIKPVIDLMEQDAFIAAAQPKIKSYANKSYFEYAGAAGGFIDKYGFPFCRGRIFDTLEEDKGQYNKPTEIFWASGAALFIKRTCWMEAEGFDADFFAHMEEIDLCWRLKNRGYKIMYCPQSEVYHVGGGTLQAESPYKAYLNFRNNLSMLTKNLPVKNIFFVLFSRLWLDLAALIKYALDRKYKHAAAVSKAHRSFFINLYKNCCKRERPVPLKSLTGRFDGSIVYNYFFKKKRTFRDNITEL